MHDEEKKFITTTHIYTYTYDSILSSILYIGILHFVYYYICLISYLISILITVITSYWIIETVVTEKGKSSVYTRSFLSRAK